MEIKRIRPGPDLAGRIRTAQKAPPRTSVLAPVATMHPLICFSAINIPQVRAVEAVGKRGEVTLIRLGEVRGMLEKGLAAFAYDAAKGQDYLVLKEAFNQHIREIYAYEKRPALANLGKKCPAAESERTLFEKVESEVLSRKGSLNNLRHLAFMLKEACEIQCDYLTATAVLLHNHDLKDAEGILNYTKKINTTMRKNIQQVLEILQRFKEIDGVTYQPPQKRSRFHIQNFMDALIKISKGNGRALLLLFAHRLSFFRMQPDNSQLISAQSAWELFAPLAERFGLWGMASKMRNEAFRLTDPENYYRCEAEIVEALGMTRREAEEYLNGVKEKFSVQMAADKIDLSLMRTRVKTPWGAEKKSEYKPENYPEIFAMNDLLAGMVVTRRPLKMEEVQRLTERALGDEFKNYIYLDNQTETKFITVGKKKIQIHHVLVLLKDGNSLELQFMSEEAYRVIERGSLAHWAYKLKMIKELSDQQFDEALLEICAQKMNGDLMHDVEIVYQTLGPWLYAFMEDDKRTLNVYRRMSGAIPLDLAVLVLNNDLSNYGGVKKAKIWEDRRSLREAAETDPLEDGDLLAIKKGNFMTQSALNLRAIMNAAQHPETKSLLLPEFPIKALRRK